MTNERKSGFIAIAGRPNAGKSTLLNRVLGAKVSIVTPKAQTTREKVLGILTEERGQAVFIDTPGIHRAKEGGINAFMVQEAKDALEAPHVAWYIVDPFSAPEHEKLVLEILASTEAPIYLLMNKQDIRHAKTSPEAVSAFEKGLTELAAQLGVQFDKIFRISAENGTGVDELMQASWARLPEGPLYYPDEDQISDRPVKFFVAEKIREQLLRQLGEELPYSCAVEIEKFQEKTQPPRIEAVIHVERDSQKGMVIGKGGTKIKSIGTVARQEIEEFLGHGVFLGLKVKVTKDWSKDGEALERLGYHLPKKGRK